jgi:hypothetical protein
MIENFRAGYEAPEYVEFSDRKECDPVEIAREITRRNLTESERNSFIADRYQKPLSKAVYRCESEFYSAVQAALTHQLYPEETNIARAITIFNPTPDQQLRPGPAHDLRKLMKQVLTHGALLLGVSRASFDGELRWTKRLVKGWYGIAYWKDYPELIKINCLLDSPDVTASTLKFLLWHEYLHIYLRQGHTELFKELESKWADCDEAKHELHTLNDRFGIQYW